jgi:hypothetical protein
MLTISECLATVLYHEWGESARYNVMIKSLWNVKALSEGEAPWFVLYLANPGGPGPDPGQSVAGCQGTEGSVHHDAVSTEKDEAGHLRRAGLFGFRHHQPDSAFTPS